MELHSFAGEILFFEFQAYFLYTEMSNNRQQSQVLKNPLCYSVPKNFMPPQIIAKRPLFGISKRFSSTTINTPVPLRFFVHIKSIENSRYYPSHLSCPPSIF